MKIQAFGLHGQFSHIFFFAAGVTTYEIRNKLLTHILFPVDAVEYFFELFKLFERMLSHDVKNFVAGVLGCHFETAAYMTADQFASILICMAVYLFFFASM